MGSKWDIGRKQLEDTFSSKKFLMIFGLFLLLSLGSVHIGVGEYENEMDRYESGNTGIGNQVPEPPSLVETFQLMVGFNLPLAAGILALLLSYNSISKEREEGTIELLLSYPVYRDEVINGKFLSGIFTVAVALLVAFIASSGYAVYRTGVAPNLTEVARIGYMWLGSVVYMAFFYGLGIFLSTVFRSSRRALITGMVVLGLFIATPFIAGIASEYIYTYDESGEDEVEFGPREVASNEQVEIEPMPDNQPDRTDREAVRAERERFVDQVSRFSPSTSYTNYVGIIMGTDYETEFPPTLGESLEQSFGYIVFLFSQTLLVFAATYTVFMKQDL